VRRSGRTWRDKSVVTVLRGRYLSGAARSCDVRTACQASLWLPNSASTNTPLASGDADFLSIAEMACTTRPALAALEPSTTIRLLR
jgi:hypothetical protein